MAKVISSESKHQETAKAKIIVFIFQKDFFVFRSSNHCHTASVRSRVPCEYVQQIQIILSWLLAISQKKCESNNTQQNGNENGECHTML